MAARDKMWRPAPGDPEQLEWWQPLLAFAGRVQAECVPWPVLVDEFTLVGRIDRRDRPRVWVYEHVHSGGRLRVDEQGLPYRPIPTGADRSARRLIRCAVRPAVYLVGLHHLSEPVFADSVTVPTSVTQLRLPLASSAPHDGPDDDGDEDDDEAPEQPGWAADHPSVRSPGPLMGRRRRHLVLLPSA